MGKAFPFIYFALLWLRWMLASLPGYVHPDEFFQSPEITASKVLNVDTLIPWEFQPEHAARSIVIPFLNTGLPLWLLTVVSQWSNSGQEVLPSLTIFLVERSACFGLTLITDYVVYKLCQRLGKDEILPLVLVATSQVTLVYNTRPFSNAMEALVLALALLSLVSYDLDCTSGFTLGGLLCFGLFTRITFILYGFPVGLAFLYLAKRQGRLLQSAVIFLLGATLVAGIIIVIDSLYYGTLTLSWQDGTPITQLQQLTSVHPFLWAKIQWHGTWTVTMLNNLIYNMNVDNLALHGLHPRYLHFLVNFPLLYGPLAIMAIWSLWSTSKKAHQTSNGYLFYVMAGSIIFGMVGLSLMPHQEARFLVPMLVPLVMIYTWDQESKIGSLFFMLVWFVFNLANSFIFGNVHQAGIVPTMALIQQQAMGIHGCEAFNDGDLTCNLAPIGGSMITDGYNVTTHVIFHKTYMPPRHLLGFPLSWKDGSAQVEIEDVAGNMTMLYNALTSRQGIPYRKHNRGQPQVEFTASKERPGTYERTLLVCPNVTPLPDIPGQRYMLISTYSPHVNFDDIGEMFRVAKHYDSPINLASLHVFAILSSEDPIQAE